MPTIKDAVSKGLDSAQSKVKELTPKLSQGLNDMVQKTGEALSDGKTKVLDAGINAKDTVMEVLDVNRNGQIDIEDIIILGMKTPGVRVDRSAFLRNELKIHYDSQTVNKAIKTSPLCAGIPTEDINKIADAVIQHERMFVSGIAAALGAPGGAAMLATIPADIIQYYGYTLIAAQKLMYLYGFPEIISSEDGAQIDTPTMNTLIVAMGVMFGVAGAHNAIKAMATALGIGVEKQLLKKALTKGAIYPIVKNVAKWFGIRMTKEVFAGFFKKAIPVAGGIVGGGITYFSFKPCCDNLKASLMDTKLSNAEHKASAKETEIFEAIISGEEDILS